MLETLNLPETQTNAFKKGTRKARPIQTDFSKLSDLCFALIVGRRGTVDCLFEIYGLATNFPIRKLNSVLLN